ncbi:MAG: site-2 protease family protein [Gammaproteobacteria bacterium]|nr:site-2 protease family protein [Gammaproteobacteria bacterium]
MGELGKIQFFVVAAIPILFAITVHEVAHGWVAKRLGDPTAMMMGRLTLNPVKHIDPIGTVLVPVAIFWLGGFLFGWAKPVPITWENLKRPKRDVAFVAVAGPAANLLMAIGWAVVMKIAILIPAGGSYFSMPLMYMGFMGILINCGLMVLNLLPLPPLDGGRIVSSVLPGPLAWKYNQLEPYGLIILLFLFITGALAWVLMPPLFALISAIGALFGINPQIMTLMQML